MKKGFTLIELLAVIVVLAVIATIGVVIVFDSIYNTRASAYIENERTFTKVAINYLTLNPNKLPNNIGEQTYISYDELVLNEAIKPIKNPYGNNYCDGYIKILKKDNEEYDYTPYLNCANQIKNPTDDQLFVHYKFIDKIEPINNIITNPTYQTTSNWSLSKNGGGIYTTSNNYAKIDIPENEMGTYYFLNQMINKTVPANQALTFSVDFKNNISGRYAIRLVLYQDLTVLKETIIPIVLDGLGGNKRAVLNLTHSVEGNRLRADILGGSYYNVYGVLSNKSFEFTNAQLEFGSDFTKFTENTYEPNLIDYSGNNNTLNLTLQTGPKWKEEGVNGLSSYYFDGTKYALSNVDSTLNSFSLITWINPYYYGNSTSKSIVASSSSSNIISLMRQTGSYSLGPMWLEYRQNGTLDVYLRDLSGNTIRYVVPILEVDKWTQIAITYNHLNSQLRVYIDGKYLSVASNSLMSSLGQFNRIYLGTGLGSTTGAHYNGSISDFKLYNRVLSEQEVKEHYLKNY